jgi:hypothetical protein
MEIDLTPGRDSQLVALLIDRNRKLEATLRAYDDAINTDAVDRMRKRIHELEQGIAEALSGEAPGVQNREKLAVILRNKLRSIY